MYLKLIILLFSVCEVLKIDSMESLVIVLNKPKNVEDILPPLQHLWTVLEEYYVLGKLTSIGVSDMDTDKFIQLFNWANVNSIVDVTK